MSQETDDQDQTLYRQTEITHYITYAHVLQWGKRRTKWLEKNYSNNENKKIKLDLTYIYIDLSLAVFSLQYKFDYSGTYLRKTGIT